MATARIPAPVLLAVEDDPAALGDVERELRDRYASSYRVICTRSPDEALASLTTGPPSSVHLV